MGKFIEALAAASAEDLAEIDAAIVATCRTLDGMKAARAVLVVKLNGRTKRKSPTPGAGSNGVARGSVRDKIALHLLHSGAASLPAIASAIGNEAKNLYAPLNHEFFKKLGDGRWTLTEDGRAHAHSLEKPDAPR